MPDNTNLETPATPGAKALTKEVSHSGDTVHLQGVSLMTATGSEGSWTVADVGVTAAPLAVKISDGTDVALVDGSGNLNVTGTVAVTNAGLTELAAAINASSQMDVNIAASGATVPVSNAGLTELAAALNVEDQASANGDAGMVVLARRTDTPANQSATDGDYEFLQVAAGRLWVDASGKTLTVDGSGVTQPVSNAGLTELAAAINASSQMDVNIAANGIGLATSAKQDTMITSLQLIDDTVFAEDVAASAADKGVAILAVRRDADTTLVDTTGDYANLQVDANGYLKVEIFDGGGSHTVDNAGTFAVQVDGNALTALQKIDDPVIVDDAGFTPATSSVMMAGFEADETATDSVDEGDGGAARMTLDRKQIVTVRGHASGGASGYNNTDVQETAAQIKGSAGTLYTLYAWNVTAAPLWLKVYDNVSASVTPGTTAPTYDLMIPANADSDGAGFVVPLPAMGLAFGTGITISGSTTRGTTAADVGTAGNLGVFAVYQ